MGFERLPAQSANGWPRRLAWLPHLLGVGLVSVLACLPSKAVFNPPYLLPALNFLFLTSISFLVAVLAARSYLAGHSAAVLLLGCGALALGLAGGLAGFPLPTLETNWRVTVYNTGAYLAAVCHLSCALLGFWPARRLARSGWPALAALYLAVLATLMLLAWAAHEHLLPVFFVEGQGATPWNLAALWTTAGMFALAGVLLGVQNRQGRSAFVFWYGLGLGLIAVGLVCVSLQKRLGSPLNWSGRTAQYLGGVYMLIAVLRARQGRRWTISLADALHEMEERYRKLVELCPDAILVHTEGKYVFANPAAATLFGAASSAELLGRDVLELVHPEDRQDVARRIRQAQTVGLAAPLMEVRILRLDGRPVNVESAGARIDCQGRPAVQVVMRDISERKRIEQALRESEACYRFLVNAIPQVLWTATPDGQQDFANRRWFEFTGLDARAVRPDVYREICHPEDLALTERAWRQAVEASQPYECLHRIRRHDGEYRWLLTRALPQRDEQGRIVRWVGTGTDITEEKLAEAALRRYEVLANNSRDIILFIRREDCRLLEANDAAVQAYGYSREELLCLGIQDLRTTEAQALAAAHMAVADAGGILFETMHRRRDGSTFPVEINSRGATIDGQRMVISVVRDITERKQAEAALRQAHDQLENRVRERTTELARTNEALQASHQQIRALAARLAEWEETERRRLARELHDQVGQTLTALGLNLNIIRQRLSADTLRRVGDRLDDAIGQLEALTDDVRQIMAELRPAVLDDYGLAATLRWYCEQYARRTGLPIELRAGELSARLPLEVETALFRIAQEALTNVAKHARARRIEVLLEETAAGIRLTLADDGVGFDPGAARGPQGQAGWGQLIMRERAAAVGGRLSVESAPGHGTRVIVEVGE